MSKVIEIHPNDEHNQKLLSQVHPSDWANPKPADKYNLVVIGGGTAGLITAAATAGLGGKVALIERHLMGGDCLNVGCLPSKTVIRSAKLLGEIRAAHEFGISVPDGVETDFGAIMARMRRIRADISVEDSVARYRDLGVDVFLGEGSFSEPNRIEVNGTTLAFKKAVIATGARAMKLPIPGLEETGYLTNDNVFNLTELPKRLAVIGAGPIGSELAQTFQRLGSQVVVFDILPQVLGREDRDAAAIVEKSMRHDGVQFMLEASIKQVSQRDDGKVMSFEHAGEQKELVFDNILMATGRVPNVEGLNLEAVNVEYHRKGVKVNDYLQTTNPNIYAAGDICMKYQFTHAADAAARIVVRNALFMGRSKVSNLTIPWATYTDPEVAHVGLYPHDAEAQGIAIDTFMQPLEDVHRAVADGDEEGFVKIHVKKGTDKIVGATIVARHAGDMISEITLAMVGKVGLSKIATVIHPYPTQAEAIKKIADAYNRTKLTSTVKRLFNGWLNFRR